MKTRLLAIGMAAALAGTTASAGSLADPIVAPQVVAADAIENSNKNMHEMLALLTVTLILTAVMTSR